MVTPAMPGLQVTRLVLWHSRHCSISRVALSCTGGTRAFSDQLHVGSNRARYLAYLAYNVVCR